MEPKELIENSSDREETEEEATREMTLQQLKEEARKEFDGKYKTYINNWNESKPEEIKDFIDSLITKAYEEGKKSLQEQTDERDCIIQKIKNWQLSRFTENEDQTMAYMQSTIADDIINHLLTTF